MVLILPTSCWVSNQKAPASFLHCAGYIITLDHCMVHTDCSSKMITQFQVGGAGALGCLTRVIEARLIILESWRGPTCEHKPCHTQTGPHLLIVFLMQFHGDSTDFFLVIEPGAEHDTCSPSCQDWPILELEVL